MKCTVLGGVTHAVVVPQLLGKHVLGPLHTVLPVKVSRELMRELRHPIEEQAVKASKPLVCIKNTCVSVLRMQVVIMGLISLSLQLRFTSNISFRALIYLL